jgi:ribosomal protein S18 acetylase RimI-like enzyme
MPLDINANEKVVLRRAVEGDATAILQVNHDAAHARSGGYYTDEVLSAWAPLSQARLEHWQSYIASPSEQALMLVATLSYATVGFGRIEFCSGELTSLYVSPHAARRGIGRALLQALEKEALKQGVNVIWLTAALNAQRFYSTNGFRAIEELEYSITNKLTMTVVKMEKLIL